ncbi:MAG: SDR family NAD(P)-dependent oxidoreductase [Nitrososphaeraceae archaeon]
MDLQSVSSLKFAGKNVLITGSGTGIGQTIACKFAEEGATIVIMGRRREPLDYTTSILEKLIKSSSSGAKVLSFPGIDVSDEIGIKGMFEVIKKQLGKIDIVINNAGVSGPVKIFPSSTFNEFRDCVSIHLSGSFWTCQHAIPIMEKGGKIITISTYFTEENRFEQRPYRFRTPYTAAQGAKNRLGEALGWELTDRGITSIVTNPGPVHSDRIYKTVYPKAAMEFLRISGYPGLTPLEIGSHSEKFFSLMGEPQDVIASGLKELSLEILGTRNDRCASLESLKVTLLGLINKTQEIAEKIQSNTRKMISDGEFLTQDQVAEMVLFLADDKLSKLLNSRVIPNDRVFYPVKPIVGSSVRRSNDQLTLKDKVIVITTNSQREKEILRVRGLATTLLGYGVKQVVILSSANHAELKEFHTHSIDYLNDRTIQRLLDLVKTRFGQIDALVHFTGDFDYNCPLLSFQRHEWQSLVDNYINIPYLMIKGAVSSMSASGAAEVPSKFRSSSGTIVIVGPDAPTGRVSGLVRARSEVFRGALRPLVTTINQELSDVLNSSIRSFLILAGSIDGREPDEPNLKQSIVSLITGPAEYSERIFYIDEAKSK